MKERILVAIKDERLLDESSTALHEHDYLVTKASGLSDMETQLNSSPQDIILLDSTLWMQERPDLFPGFGQTHSETPIIHLISNGDQDTFKNILKNGDEGTQLVLPVTGKEILLMVDQVIKSKQIKERFKQMRNELLEANKNLSNRTREFQERISLYTDLFHSMTLGVITVDTGFFVKAWNAGIAGLTGIDESVATGSNLFDIIPALSAEGISERVKEVIVTGEPMELDHLKTHRPNGEEAYVDFRIAPLKRKEETVGAVLVMEDVTHEIHRREEADRAHGYIGNLVDNAADAIVSLNPDGIIITWNKGAEMTFGYSAQEAIGRPWEFLFSEHDNNRIYNLFEWVKKSGPVSNFETRVISMSGEYIPVSLTLSLIRDAGGNVYGLSGIFRDLSDTKKLTKQLIQSQKMMTLGSMAARMAHDLNNPLASLSTYTHLLMTRTNLLGVDKLTENLAKVEEDAERIGQLVKDLLWYSSPSDHTTGIVDIHEVLRKSLSFAAYLVDMDAIEIKKDYEARIPPILANSKELIQSFVNILTNAVAAMPEGGTIIIRTSTCGTEDDKGILITISDTGIGIPEENLPNIFEQFFSTRSGGKGNGLGLYVAKSIIEDHHGEIHVESEVNTGTTCTLRLPITSGTP